MSHLEGDTSSDIIAGITTLYTTHARLLSILEYFTHSYRILLHANITFSSLLPIALGIRTIRIDLDADRCIMSWPVIFDRVFLANLVLLPIKNFDVVLGMDWLTRHHTSNNGELRTVTFAIPGEESSSTKHVRALSFYDCLFS